jgi:hypothetical protein
MTGVEERERLGALLTHISKTFDDPVLIEPGEREVILCRRVDIVGEEIVFALLHVPVAREKHHRDISAIGLLLEPSQPRIDPWTGRVLLQQRQRLDRAVQSTFSFYNLSTRSSASLAA